MVRNIKFSVIIPIFNVEEYLCECLDSILNQSYQNFEIICVNDGSTDNSLDILNEYAKKDERITVIDQENKGTGVARNNGMKLATGDYIAFIDPDDWIEKDMFSALNDYISKYNSQVLEFGVTQYDEASMKYEDDKQAGMLAKKCRLDLSNLDSYCWKDVKNILLHYKSYSCKKVYSRKFLTDNNIEFAPHKRGEDIPFSVNVLLCAERIDVIHKKFYNYRRRPNSASTSLEKQDMFYIFDQIDITKSILEKTNFQKILKDDFNAYRFRLVYDADKKCAKEYRKEVNKKAKAYLPLCDYIRYLFVKNISRIFRTIFSYKKHYQSSKKVQITLLGFKIVV